MSLYQVITTSKLQQGVEPKQAIQQLGKLLNLSPEQSQKLLEKPLIFKKGLDAEQAKKLRIRLEKAGLQVVIKAMDATTAPRKKSDSVNVEQSKKKEKLVKTPVPVTQTIQEPISEPKDIGYISRPSVILCLLVAVLGAVICAYLPIALLSITNIAIIIAIAIFIGKASVYGDSHGLIAGGVCALLFVVSVMGGKSLGYIYKEQKATAAMTSEAHDVFTDKQRALAKYSPEMDNKTFAVMLKGFTENKLDLTNANNEVIAKARPEYEKKILDSKNEKFKEWYVKYQASKMKDTFIAPPPWALVRFNFINMIILIICMLSAFRSAFMGKLVTLRFPSNMPINWPVCCSKCLSENKLTWNIVTSERVSSVFPTFTGSLRVGTELMNMQYPVCKKHKSSFGNYAYTQKTIYFQMLRGYLYIMGPISLLFTLSLPISLFDTSLLFSGFFIVTAVFFVCLVKEILTCPVKISLKNGFFKIKFSNDEFAHQFKRQNLEVVRLLN